MNDSIHTTNCNDNNMCNDIVGITFTVIFRTINRGIIDIS